MQRNILIRDGCKVITKSSSRTVDLNETKHNLTRKCLSYNATRDFIGNGAAIKHSFHAYETAWKQRKDFVSPLCYFCCNHKFSPESLPLVHFCIVNRIAHSETKQVVLFSLFPIAICAKEESKCILSEHPSAKSTSRQSLAV